MHHLSNTMSGSLGKVAVSSALNLCTAPYPGIIFFLVIRQPMWISHFREQTQLLQTLLSNVTRGLILL